MEDKNYRCPLCGQQFQESQALLAENSKRVRCPHCGYEFDPDQPRFERLAKEENSDQNLA